MAEHYGVKPKIFTKAWWPYFWMYYKWHVVIGAFAAAVIIPGVWQMTHRVEYDLDVTYFGKSYFTQSALDTFTDALETEMSDANDNGEINLGLSCLQVSDEQGMEEMNYTMQVKHDLAFSDEYAYLYIYDKEKLESIASAYPLSDLYEPIEDWYDATPDEVFTDENGIAYAVSLKDSGIFADMDVDSSNMYVAVRTDNESKETNATVRENAVKVANKLVK